MSSGPRSRHPFVAAADGDRRTPRHRARSFYRSTWTSSGATSITTTWCTNPSHSSSGVTRMHPISRAGWSTTARCPRTFRSRHPTRPLSSAPPDRRTTPGWRDCRRGWGRGGRPGRRRSDGGRRASTRLSPNWGSVFQTSRPTQNCLKSKLYAWRPVTSPTWWRCWPKTPGRRKVLKPKSRNLTTGI